MPVAKWRIRRLHNILPKCSAKYFAAKNACDVIRGVRSYPAEYYFAAEQASGPPPATAPRRRVFPPPPPPPRLQRDSRTCWGLCKAAGWRRRRRAPREMELNLSPDCVGPELRRPEPTEGGEADGGGGGQYGARKQANRNDNAL